MLPWASAETRTAEGRAGQRPNSVFILADDMPERVGASGNVPFRPHESRGKLVGMTRRPQGIPSARVPSFVFGNRYVAARSH
jgi:hypothetical protein